MKGSDPTSPRLTPAVVADGFLAAARDQVAHLQGSRIYDMLQRDFMAKTEQLDEGYAGWLATLVPHLVQHYGLPPSPRILDFGSGFGELTVLLNLIGHDAIGVDLHEGHMAVARVLAAENGLGMDRFVLNTMQGLPFDSDAFDILTLFVVLEHLDDAVLNELLPEFKRVCSGVIYILVPNKLQLVDDHTGLRFVPWFPRRLAEAYVARQAWEARYHISASKTWDVQYRTYGRIKHLFRRHGFALDFVPESAMYPSLDVVPPVHDTLHEWAATRHNPVARALYKGCALSFDALQRLGYPKQAFYPYLNLVARRVR